MQDSQQVYEALREIAAFLRFAGEQRFKIDAYEQGAEIVKTVGPELGARVEQDRLRELQGIGAALSRQIQELWNTGSSALLPVALAAGLLAEAETLAITLVLRGWRHDVPSVWNALRVRA